MTPTSTKPVPREVPTFAAQEFRSKRADYCVCVFADNDNGQLHGQLDKIQQYLDLADIVVADAGSSDGSTDKALLLPRGVNALLVKTGPGALGAQMRIAFSWALQRGYQGVVCLGGDGKDGPDAIPRFIEKLKEGVDLVQGSRFLPGGVSENMPLGRWLGVKLLHGPLVRVASCFNYTDTTNGFRAYSRRLLESSKLAIFRDVFVADELRNYLAIRAVQLGFKVCEIQVARRYPANRPTPNKINPAHSNLSVLGCLVKAVIGRYDYKESD